MAVDAKSSYCPLVSFCSRCQRPPSHWVQDEQKKRGDPGPNMNLRLAHAQRPRKHRNAKIREKHETAPTHFRGCASVLNAGRAGSRPHEAWVNSFSKPLTVTRKTLTHKQNLAKPANHRCRNSCRAARRRCQRRTKRSNATIRHWGDTMAAMARRWSASPSRGRPPSRERLLACGTRRNRGRRHIPSLQNPKNTERGEERRRRPSQAFTSVGEAIGNQMRTQPVRLEQGR